MADISMCVDHHCPLNSSCYRYTATPSERQSYSNFCYDLKEESCDYYWYDKVENEDES